MKIVETVTPVNHNKTIAGDHDIKLTLDTETDELTIVTPAMFSSPKVKFDELKDALDKLAEHANR